MVFHWLTGKYYNYDKELWALIAKMKSRPNNRDRYMERAQWLRAKLKDRMREAGFVYPDSE